MYNNAEKLLLIGVLAAVIIANSPIGPQYFYILDTNIHVLRGASISAVQVVQEFLLAFFFFLLSLELKKEFVKGEFSSVKKAFLPVICAVCGIAFSATLFLVFISFLGLPNLGYAWGCVISTDIAISLAIFTGVTKGTPTHPRIENNSRTFLMALAIVDDLIGMVVIAVFYGASISFLFLLVTVVPIILLRLILIRKKILWVLFIPLVLVLWAFVYLSGIHAALTGAIIGFLVPMRGARGMYKRATNVVKRIDTVVYVAILPLFAFVSGGIVFSDIFSFDSNWTPQLCIGLFLVFFLCPVFGKPLGIILSTYFLTHFTSFKLPARLRTRNIAPAAFLASTEFTVSFLIISICFHASNPKIEGVGKLGIFATMIAAFGLGLISSKIFWRKKS
jgi:NhaA family Na+:H+ antiporter